jgi:hypothetical protein
MTVFCVGKLAVCLSAVGLQSDGGVPWPRAGGVVVHARPDHLRCAVLPVRRQRRTQVHSEQPYAHTSSPAVMSSRRAVHFVAACVEDGKCMRAEVVGFEVLGSNLVWYPAHITQVTSSTVALQASLPQNIVASHVRYAWYATPACRRALGSGLPRPSLIPVACLCARRTQARQSVHRPGRAGQSTGSAVPALQLGRAARRAVDSLAPVPLLTWWKEAAACRL